MKWAIAAQVGLYPAPTAHPYFMFFAESRPGGQNFSVQKLSGLIHSREINKRNISAMIPIPANMKN